MTQDAWPSPDAPSGPLPRLDDLPIADQGYDQEAVRLAFDSFYRHAAQLDASLRALEAVEVFRRDADALRNDLRALRELGLAGSPEPAWPSLRYEAPPREVPVVVFRLAFEAALIIAVAVIAGVAHFRAAVVVALMAAAFVVVAVSEWLGARGRFVSPAAGFAPVLPEGEPAPYVEAPASVWAAPEPSDDSAPSDDTEAEGLTIVPVAAEAEPEPEPEPEPEAKAAAEAEPLAAEEPDEPAEDEADDEPPLDPWEQGVVADDDSDEEPALVERGFFRRRRR